MFDNFKDYVTFKSALLRLLSFLLTRTRLYHKYLYMYTFLYYFPTSTKNVFLLMIVKLITEVLKFSNSCNRNCNQFAFICSSNWTQTD